MSRCPVRVQLTFRDGRIERLDAARARLDGAELVLETADGTIRVPSASVEEWSVRKLPSPATSTSTAAP